MGHPWRPICSLQRTFLLESFLLGGKRHQGATEVGLACGSAGHTEGLGDASLTRFGAVYSYTCIARPCYIYVLHFSDQLLNLAQDDLCCYRSLFRPALGLTSTLKQRNRSCHYLSTLRYYVTTGICRPRFGHGLLRRAGTCFLWPCIVPPHEDPKIVPSQ